MNYHLTLKSTNRKTGPIPVSTTSADSCWPSCPLYDHGCYASAGKLSLFWAKVSDGRLGSGFAEFLAKVAALPHGQLWRHNQAGDLPGFGAAVDAPALAQLVEANAGKRGFTYTHKPMTAENIAAVQAANDRGFTINLSANNLAHADELAALEIAPVVTVLPQAYARKEQRTQWAETVEKYRARLAGLPMATPQGRKIAVCPATYLDKVTCASCGLCQRGNRKIVIGFPAHGAGKAKADAVAKG